MITLNHKVIVNNGKWIGNTSPSLLAYTIRLRYKDGVTPTFYAGTATQVSSSPNIWDFTYENWNWADILYNHTDLLEVIDGNTSGVTVMSGMFYGCSSLTTVPLFNTSNVTDISQMFTYCTSLTSVPLFNTSSVTDMHLMFYNCTSLTSIPLFDTSNVTDMKYMFYDCINVESGALALYQQASSLGLSQYEHLETFANCGSNTQTGAAELAQIPYDWK